MDLTVFQTALINALPLILAGGAVVGLMWYLARNPDNKFKPFYPLVIQAVKAAERLIPNDSPNKGLAKADAFLQEFIKMYSENTGKEVSEALKSWALRSKEIVIVELDKINKK